VGAAASLRSSSASIAKSFVGGVPASSSWMRSSLAVPRPALLLNAERHMAGGSSEKVSHWLPKTPRQHRRLKRICWFVAIFGIALGTYIKLTNPPLPHDPGTASGKAYYAQKKAEAAKQTAKAAEVPQPSGGTVHH